MPGVEPGAAAFPIISSRPSAETPAESASVTSDIPAQTFAASLLRPQAAQAQVEFSREDAAGFPSMSDALGKVIVDAVGLADGLDSASCLSGTTEWIAFRRIDGNRDNPELRYVKLRVLSEPALLRIRVNGRYAKLVSRAICRMVC